MARVGQRLGRGTAEASGAVASLQFFIEAVVTLFSSVARSRLTLCDPMDCSMPGLPVHHQLPEFTQTHVHQVGDAIQPSHPLLLPSIFPSIRVFSNIFSHHFLLELVSILLISKPVLLCWKSDQELSTCL